MRFKWRAVLATGAAGAGIGGLLGAAVLGVTALLDPGSVPLAAALGGPLALGSFGFLAGSGFATLLAFRPPGSLEALSVWRSAVFGGVLGVVFPAATAVVTVGFVFPLEAAPLVWAGAFFGILGGATTAGLVAIAKTTPARLKPSPHQRQLD